MKTLFKLLTAAALALAAVTDAPAQAFSGTGTAISTTHSYFIQSPNYGSGIPTVTHLDVSLTGADTNSATALVRFYNAGDFVALTGGSASGASTLTASTNGLAANDVLAVRKRSSDQWQRVTVSSLSGSTITLNETLSWAVTNRTDGRASDGFYKMTVAGQIGNVIHLPSGKITLNGGGTPIFVGAADRPTMTEVFGAATPVLRNVAGVFITPNGK